MSFDDIVAREFPRLQTREAMWLNTASTGPLPERARQLAIELVEKRMEPWRFGATEQFATLDRSRELCAALIGAAPDEIALMVNTNAGLNLAARALPLTQGDVVVTSDRDFPANVYPWMAMARDTGVAYHKVPCRGGLFDEDALVAALDRPRVKVLVVSWVSFESGIRLDLERLGAACRERGISFVVDAMQGLGPLTLDVGTTPIDILSCGAQKWLLGPWGSAFTYIRRPLVRQLEPKNVGWMAVKGSDDFTQLLNYRLEYRDDARRFEGVTLPYQDFALMNAALEVIHEVGPAAIAQRVLELTTRIVDWALDRSDMRLVTPREPARRAGIVAIAPRDPVEASARLTREGVGHSLREGAIRLAPYFFTPVTHVDRALEILGRAD